MNKIITFIKGSIDEIKNNVSWPPYIELQNSSVLVLVASLVFALLIFGIDYLFEGGMGAIYQSFQSSFEPTVNTPVQ
jgi:preprotein translocase subunit SecE